MLYYLFEWLDDLNIPGAGVFHYISFRAACSFISSLLIVVVFGRPFIRLMRRKGIGENTRADEREKEGTPTMGGVLILAAIIIPSLLFARLDNIYVLIMLGTTLWLGTVGFIDDYIKMKRSKDGMRPLCKLLGQAVLGLVIGLTLWQSPDAVISENIREEKHGLEQVVRHRSEEVKSTITTIPFVKNNNLNYADLFRFLGRYRTAAGWILFVLVTTFIVMAVSNGSNLNDGMDGMCAGNAAIMCIALGILAYVSSHIHMAAYLNIMYIPGSEELVIFICAFVGALIGFLWYNAYPAQVFMGDTGSLAIGGIIGVTAIIIHKELLLPLLCFVFFMESLSVILQTNYARRGNRRGEKWRVFKRAPLHDTFRVRPGQLPADFKVLIDWPKGCWLESKITVRFWIVTIIMSALAIVTLKIR